MGKLKAVVAAVLSVAMACLLSGCLTYTFVSTGFKQQETYCSVSLSPPGYKALNGALFDLSHRHGIGVYIVDDLAPGVPDYTGKIQFSEEGYAEQVRAAHDELEPYDDYIMLAIGNNLTLYGEGGDAFADVAAVGAAEDVLSDDACEQLAAEIAESLDAAKVAGEGVGDEPVVPADEYADILYKYLEEVIVHLDAA